MLKRCLLFMLWPVVLLLAGAGRVLGQAQNQPWQSVERAAENRPSSDFWIRPTLFRSFHLDHAALKSALARASNETAQSVPLSQAELSLPMPDGSLARFRIVESPVMAPELAAKFPEIKTYFGQGIDDPAASVRFDTTPAGFHAQILSPNGAVYIDPQFRGDTNLYATYFKRDYRRTAEAFECLAPAGDTAGLLRAAPAVALRSGSNLRTYRLACAATGEYTQFHGGTVSAGMAAIVTAINRVTGVYEAELAIRLVLVANNDLLIYTNGSTDPYSNTSGSTMLGQNQSNVDSVIGDANYDIGHVFSTGGGGIAYLGIVCVTGNKARGVTGLSSPTGDGFYIDYVAHEMGHQFGANHTFNSATGSCGGGNRNDSTAYEPGSGTTIMAYAGICGTDNLQTQGDPYFHSASFDEILAYSTTGSGNNCPVLTASGNSVPTVNAGANYTIPASTPFVLTADGSDANGDPLTYCWEERDLGPAITLATPDNGSSPLFRSFKPRTNLWRTFPKLSDILNNTSTPGEMLPTTSRTMNFRVTVRDNRAGGGGVNTADTQVTVIPGAGPFAVTFPNGGGTLAGAQTVTWNVAGTAGAPINAANVNILLSTNGGQSFPILLAAGMPNDGSQFVLLPNVTAASARIKVEAAGNIFFDISDASFAITPGSPAPFVVLESTLLASEYCGPTNNSIDAGEMVTVNFALKNTGARSTTNLVATLLATNGVAAPSGPQAYGALPAGGAAVSHPVTFTAAGTCGGAIMATLHLQDGAADLGVVNQTFNLGVFSTATTSFTNPSALTIPASGSQGAAELYPSTLSVAGLTGQVTKITVTLAGLGHTRPDDIDALLVGPAGQNVLFLSDTGGGNSISGVNLTFDDDAAGILPDGTQITSGMYSPTNFGAAADAFLSPAPVAPFGTALAVFKGSDPNGTWSLFINDDRNSETGILAQGWQLNITTSNLTCCSGGVTSTPPVLPSQDHRTVAELTTLVVTNTVLNPGAPASSLTYSLLVAPTNAVISTNGVITWTPNESQGPGTNSFTTVVVNDAMPELAAANSFTVVVTEVNVAPMLVPISDQLIVSGETLVVTNVAADTDRPLNALTFSLDPGAPAGASINATNGIFTWPTTGADGFTTNRIRVRVADDGMPPSEATNTFSVAVTVTRPLIECICLSGSDVTVTWTSVAGATYRLQYKTNSDDTGWTELPPDVVATGAAAFATDSTRLAERRFYRVMVVPR